ncbi:MAG TPA: regulatory iron-sulfur-containing complex subunit RicT [Candidatus Atribacteria bacterium]|nr:regulatory iron-sulfur-containing complex subunit RicT [Candidatus Atribacteria bacterium]HPU08094.1 regulatory iron-sulfur-containing complex subunit RicT [Candidatus Atribacteria bacterium]
MPQVVGIKFENNPKIYHFETRGLDLHLGDKCVVETAMGLEIGTVAKGAFFAPPDNFKPVIRKAQKIDLDQAEANREKERVAFQKAQDLVAQYQIPMKLLRVHYTLDRGKLTFYFGSEERVDFRQLVKELAAIFRTRIELRQVGVRDEARMMGGCGMCGRELCCSTFLTNFDPISIKMAKDQNLVLNSAKISGICGRLMCCLAFEYPLYRRLIHRFPKKGSKIVTPLGLAKILEVDIFKDSISLELDSGKKVRITEEEYHRYFL